MALGGGSLLWTHKQRRRETIIITEHSSYEQEALPPHGTRRGQLTVDTQTEKTRRETIIITGALVMSRRPSFLMALSRAAYYGHTNREDMRQLL